MLDLTDATNCIRAMRANSTYHGERIGRITQSVNTSTIGRYRPGDVVIFTPEVSPTDSELQMGEYRGMRQRPTGRVTIETPMSPEWIEREKTRGSLLTTFGTVIGVPENYVEEIRM